MKRTPDRLRVETPARQIGVDRENRIIRGYVVAQLGPFKSEGRGEFDTTSLERIVELWPASGLKSRFAHPTESSDGLGKYLGRARDPYLSEVLVDGKPVPAVRANLHLDGSAEDTPHGNLAKYVMDVAESDPAAISSSLVLSKDEEYRLNKDGSRLTDDSHNPLPPIWRPKRLYATDVVDEGDAVDGILSAEPERYTRDYLAKGSALLDSLFSGQPRATVQARCQAWLKRYLDRRYGQMGYEQLGPQLGSILDDYIEQAVSDERPREVIMGQMAEGAGITVEEVSAIVMGNDVPITAATLEAFAKVLEAPLSELIAAAEADGITFGAEGEGDTPTDAPADPATPPADPAAPAPMSHPGSNWVRRRKLDLIRRRLDITP